MATKCVRVTSVETAEDVTRTLVEKFRPDMKMLSNPNYSLYEVHPNGGKKPLGSELTELGSRVWACKFHVWFPATMGFQ